MSPNINSPTLSKQSSYGIHLPGNRDFHNKAGVLVPSPGQPARVTAGGQLWRGETWGSSLSARSTGSASFGNENYHPSPGTERGNSAQVACVRARVRGQQQQGEEAEGGWLDPQHQLILFLHYAHMQIMF